MRTRDVVSATRAKRLILLSLESGTGILEIYKGNRRTTGGVMLLFQFQLPFQLCLDCGYIGQHLLRLENASNVCSNSRKPSGKISIKKGRKEESNC
jgi:hypothetical protein